MRGWAEPAAVTLPHSGPRRSCRALGIRRGALPRASRSNPRRRVAGRLAVAGRTPSWRDGKSSDRGSLGLARAGAVPAEDRVWFHDEQRISPPRDNTSESHEKARSQVVNIGFLTVRDATVRCCRKSVFSATSSSLERNTSLSSPPITRTGRVSLQATASTRRATWHARPCEQGVQGGSASRGPKGRVSQGDPWTKPLRGSLLT